MGRPYTHGSLDREQGWLGGLMVQTSGAKIRRPCVSQTCTADKPGVHRGQARRAPRTSQARTADKLGTHRGQAKRAPQTSQAHIGNKPSTHLKQARHTPRMHRERAIRALLASQTHIARARQAGTAHAPSICWLWSWC